MNIGYENRWFQNFLDNTFANFCDGFGVSLGAKILGANIKHRNTPPDWIPNLSKECTKNNITLGLIGSSPGISEKTADIIKTEIPKSKNRIHTPRLLQQNTRTPRKRSSD